MNKDVESNRPSKPFSKTLWAEMQRVLVSSSPSRVRMSRVRVQMRRTRVRVRVQQVSSPSPSPCFCVSSPNPSPEEKNWRALARGKFEVVPIFSVIDVFDLQNLHTAVALPLFVNFIINESKFNYFGNQCCCCAITRHYEINENVFLLVFVNIKNNFDKTIKNLIKWRVWRHSQNQTFVVTTHGVIISI